MVQHRTYAVGAEVTKTGASFRLWAPLADKVNLIAGPETEKVSLPMEKEADGYFSCHIAEWAPGVLYQFQLDDDEKFYPDPASRFQPLGPHGPSQLETSDNFDWTDSQWRGLENTNCVIYEMHIGTFTPE